MGLSSIIIIIITSPSRGLRLLTTHCHLLLALPVSIGTFPGPMTDADGRREPAGAERYRRELDKPRVATDIGENVNVAGPLPDSNEGRDPVTAERCRRVVVVEVADVACGPSLNAQGSISDSVEGGVLELDAKRRIHELVVVLNSFETPPH